MTVNNKVLEDSKIGNCVVDILEIVYDEDWHTASQDCIDKLRDRVKDFEKLVRADIKKGVEELSEEHKKVCKCHCGIFVADILKIVDGEKGTDVTNHCHPEGCKFCTYFDGCEEKIPITER